MARIIGFNHFQLGQEEWISNLKQNPGLSMLLVNGFHCFKLTMVIRIRKDLIRKEYR